MTLHDVKIPLCTNQYNLTIIKPGNVHIAGSYCILSNTLTIFNLLLIVSHWDDMILLKRYHIAFI